jgi:predicted metal-dependent phosphoesterase TrpH
MRADFHVHSTASDGTSTPEELVALAVKRGLDVIALTDHDSVEGIPAALSAACGSGLTVVPAVELSAISEGIDVHVLAYFIDRTDPALLAELFELRAARARRAIAMVAALSDAGYEVTLDDVNLLAGEGAVGRAHIARALVASGDAESVSDAFKRLIGRDCPFYVPKLSAPPSEVVSRMRQLGAVPVLAHPGVTGVDYLIPELVDAGLLGIEAYHADHTPEQRERYAKLAASLGVLATGGTDFHGPGSRNPELGAVDVPSEAVEALLAAGRGR